MTNQIQTQSDFLDFIKGEAMPNGNLSIRGVERCCGIGRSAIFKGGDFKAQKLGQSLVAHGFESGDLLDEGFPPQAVWLCIEYFAYDSKAKAPIAKQLARTFGSIGIQQTLKQLTEPPKSPAPALPQRDAIEYLSAIERLPNLTNPILRSALEQRFAEELTATRVLPGSSDDDLVLVSVLAREMGYSLAPNEDARLGKWVRKHHEPTGQAQHGRYSVNVYRRSEIIDTVRAFFR